MVAESSPLVSILLPAYNADASLGACLRSVLRQSERRWECVLVDDGSTDRTAHVALEAFGADGRLRYVTAGRNGLVAALNAGLDHCRGAYIARMDADDLMHRERLADQVAELEARPELDAVGCHVRVFPRGAMGPGYRDYERWINGIDSDDRLRRELFVECPVAHPSLLFRRNCLVDAGYRDLGWPEDYDLILRLAAAGKRVGILPRRRLLWRHGPDRLSLSDPAYAPSRFTALKAAFLAEGFLAHSEQYVLWGYGGTGRALRRELQVLGKRTSHIVELHPGRLGNRIHGAPVLPPHELPRLPRRPIIASVAGSEARRRIREALEQMGFRELDDFVCAAERPD